jgi:hypothetical protein
MEPIAKVKLLAYKAGLPGALLFFSDTCLLTPLIPKAFGTGLARHETGQNCKQIIFLTIESLNRVCFVLKS